MAKMRFVFATGSKQRRQLFAKTGFVAKFIAMNVREKSKGDPRKLVAQNAHAKAIAAQKRFPSCACIGADTLVWQKNGRSRGWKVFGKPKGTKDAKRMLDAFNGKMHFVGTGIAILNGGKCVEFCEISKVYFKTLEEKQILGYIKTNEWKNKAGSYALQGKGRRLISKIKGSRDNVIGLPAKELAKRLRRMQKA